MSELAALLADLAGGDAGRSEVAAAALLSHGEAGLAALTPLLHDSNADTRWWAVRSLSGFAQPVAGELLTAALADADPAVRQCAALGLARRPHAAAIPILIACLGADDGLLARLAGDALVAQGAAAVDPLIAALDAAPHNARVEAARLEAARLEAARLEAARLEAARLEAARALALIGDTRAIPALFKLLDTDSAVLEHWASHGLEKMGVGMTFFQP